MSAIHSLHCNRLRRKRKELWESESESLACVEKEKEQNMFVLMPKWKYRKIKIISRPTGSLELIIQLKRTHYIQFFICVSSSSSNIIIIQYRACINGNAIVSPRTLIFFYDPQKGILSIFWIFLFFLCSP